MGGVGEGTKMVPDSNRSKELKSKRLIKPLKTNVKN